MELLIRRGFRNGYGHIIANGTLINCYLIENKNIMTIFFINYLIKIHRV